MTRRITLPPSHPFYEWAYPPPPPPPPRYRYQEVAEKLTRDPGKWTPWPAPLTERQASNMAHNINSGRRGAFPPSRFEARVRWGRCYVRAKTEPS